MSYIKPFQSVALFESTFKHQINPRTSRVENRKFVFDRKFGSEPGELPVEAGKYRLIWMPGCPHSNKAVITLRLLGLDKVISIGECSVLRDPRGWVFDEDIGGVDPVLKIHYLDDAYLAHIPSVRVVHGKGTGALRKGIHNYLRRVKYVSSFHLAEFGEGDAGVTIVNFKK